MIPHIPYGRHAITQEDIDAVVNVLRDGPLTQGPHVEAFEQAMAAYVGSRYAVAVSSGTSALHVACLAAGLAPGDKLVTSPTTFVASANGALYCGADPAFVDIDRTSLNMSPQSLRAAFDTTSAPKVVIPVHFAGLPCSMSEIRTICQKSKTLVIEDAAHALGSTYPEGGRVGNGIWSDMTIFSFHPVKLIAAGEGGMVTTNDESLYRRLLRLRSHGINKLDDPLQHPSDAYTGQGLNRWYYEMQDLGFNYRLTDIQAALALSQLKRIDQFVSRRRQLVLRYDQAFQHLRHLSPAQPGDRTHSAHHIYPVRIQYKTLGISRRDVMERLQTQGIGTQVHYIPVYRHPYYDRFNISSKNFPQSESYYDEALTLPLYSSMTDDEHQRVINAVLQIVS